LTYANSTLTADITGQYNDNLPLANVTIAGATKAPKSVSVTIAGQKQNSGSVMSRLDSGVLYLTGFANATQGGVWRGDGEKQVVIKLNY